MTSTVDFPTWFSLGAYGGLACCMCAIAANALYTTLSRRGTTRQLAAAIVTCVISALMLLPAIVWYQTRFSIQQASLPVAEIQVVLAYVALFGWLLPFNITAAYYLFTERRLSATSSFKIPGQKRMTRHNSVNAVRPPRYQIGVLPPYVFNSETAWGWLEYHGGSFQGQRLALKRSIVRLGREEDNDIWVDDDLASRYHAELALYHGQVYVTDCNSLNGVLLNGRRIFDVAVIHTGEMLEIGTQRFIFLLAKQHQSEPDVDDPLARLTWRSSLDMLSTSSDALPTASTVIGNTAIPTTDMPHALPADEANVAWESTAPISTNKITPLPQVQVERKASLLIQDGDMAGTVLLLDRPVITFGRGIECDVVLVDVSISRQHAQFLKQTSGDYVQDLTSRNGTRVNDESLLGPRFLQNGDTIQLGNIRVVYMTTQIVNAPSLFNTIWRA